MSAPPGRRGALLGVLATLGLLVAATVLPPAADAAAKTRASFTQMEQQFMCIECHEALNVAQSQESYSERSFLRLLIAQGLDPQQIKAQFVANYGPAVLSTPPASGFNLLIYVLPPALLALAILSLVITIPRWRRQTRNAASIPRGSEPSLDPLDARRLDEDLARHT